MRFGQINGRENLMKPVMNFTLNLALAAVLIVIASATISADAGGLDTCVGLGATIGGTCTPLTNLTSGSTDNTAFGFQALENNTTGVENTATGVDDLNANTTGNNSTATGAFALDLNTTGSGNSAHGVSALFDNTTGDGNTAIGASALGGNTTGSFNIGIGSNAGGGLTTGDNNIDIFDPGVAGEGNTIRIGTQGTQTATFIAGIFGGPKIKKGCDVVAASSGLLGCMKSSARYKRDIHDMGDASDKLMKLRPVTFQYKEDSEGTRQYGLIAEEVEKVYPELVVDDSDGKAETVEYQVLPAMLLNEVQKERREIERKTVQLAALNAQIAEMKASMRRQNVAFEERLSRIEQTVASSDGGRKLAAAFER
jgi:hypothetical protein